LYVKVSAVYYHEGRLLRKVDDAGLRRLTPDDHLYAAGFEGSACLFQPLQHETIVPLIGVRIAVGYAKEDNKRFVQLIGLQDRVL